MWSNPQIAYHKKNHELKLIIQQTQHKKIITHVFKILNTTDTSYGKNDETLSINQEI